MRFETPIFGISKSDPVGLYQWDNDKVTGVTFNKAWVEDLLHDMKGNNRTESHLYFAFPLSLIKFNFEQSEDVKWETITIIGNEVLCLSFVRDGVQYNAFHKEIKPSNISGIQPNKLTMYQKLQALQDRFYQRMKWHPKKGDYYTTSRNDLQLYQIVDEDDNYFYTVYCTDGRTTSRWDKSGFTTEGFGPMRVHVSDYIFNLDTPNNFI